VTWTQISPLIRQQPVPLLVVPLVHDGRFDISTEKTERFTFIVFYRELTARSAARRSASPCSNRRWREGARSRSDIDKRDAKAAATNHSLPSQVTS